MVWRAHRQHGTEGGTSGDLELVYNEAVQSRGRGPVIHITPLFFETRYIQRVLNEKVSVFQKCYILTKVQSSKINLSESCKYFGSKKARTTPYWPQGNSVLERVHSTMHNMLAMYCDVAHVIWTQLLSFVQIALNTAYSSTIHETPHYLMFGRMPTIPIGVIMGMP